MNSGQIVSTTSASTWRSGEPFCVTIGNTTRWRMPSMRCRCGWNSSSESRKSGTPNPSACHRRKSATDAARYAASCGNRGASASIESDDRVDEGGCRRGRVALLGNRAVLRLQRLQAGGGLLEAQPRGIGLHVGGEGDGRHGDLVLEDLGFADDGVDRDVRHVNLRSRVTVASATWMRPIGRSFKARREHPAMCCGPVRLSCVEARIRGGLRHGAHVRATGPLRVPALHPERAVRVQH